MRGALLNAALVLDLLLSTDVASVAGAPLERVRWDKIPIPLVLPVGHERLVHFPAPVRVGVPAHLGRTLRTQSADGVVYWRASAPFDTARVQVRESLSGRTYLFDLTAVEGALEAGDIEITVPAAENEVAEHAHSARTDVGYIALTRFAAQQLYAPRRLLRDLPGVHRVPVPDEGPVALVRGAAIEAVPLIAWATRARDEAGTGATLYVTAVRLRNRSAHPVVLDPRTTLRGRWLAATFHHARLRPAERPGDTTAVYLVSAWPFDEALSTFGEVP